MPSAAEKVRRAQASLAYRARLEVVSVWPKISELPPERVAAVMAELLQEVAKTYGTGAASLAADFYDELRSAAGVAGGFAADPAEMPSSDRFQALSQWGSSPLFSANPNSALALSLMTGGLERIVLNAGRDTIADAVSLDPSGPRYARHASANACAFCAMVASRGPVYRSEASAGGVVGRGTALSTNVGRTQGRMARGIRERGTRNIGTKYHDYCHCTTVPVWPGQNYDEAPYVAKWREAYLNAPAKPGEAIDLKKTLASMRAELGTS